MSLATFLCTFLVATCFVPSCLSDPVPNVVETSERNAAVTNTYFITTYTRGANADHVLIENSINGVGALTYLDGTQTVVILVHGRESSAHSEFAFSLRTALAGSDPSCAVIVVDWSAVAFSGYNQARALVPQVAQHLSDFIELMVAGQKLNRNLLHLIGFDLGAHVVGIASRNGPTRARKITALSPAGAGWDQFSARLRSTDAQYVEVIHTDAVGGGAFGMAVTQRVGHLDFFPNGATRQPGCFTNACNHNRAWQLFLATVQTGGHLLGVRCDTLSQALNNSCSGLGLAVMGTNQLIKSGIGMYHMNTGSAFPY